MSELSKATLRALRDYIGDALSDPDVTPMEIAQAIRDELSDLIEYHRVSLGQAEKTLSLLAEPQVTDLHFHRYIKEEAYEDAQDSLMFGGDYDVNKFDEFKLDSPFLNLNSQWGDDDIISFDDYKNKK